MVGKPYEYEKGSPFNACLLFGLHITTMGQINPRRDDDADEPQVVQHISRGSSEVWYTHPRPYRSAWAAENDNTIRLVLSGDYLVGALVIGEQSLTDSLRYLIEHQVNIGDMFEELSAGGPRMRRCLMQFWQSILPEPTRV